jgi:hypothetical protein
VARTWQPQKLVGMFQRAAEEQKVATRLAAERQQRVV